MPASERAALAQRSAWLPYLCATRRRHSVQLHVKFGYRAALHVHVDDDVTHAAALQIVGVQLD